MEELELKQSVSNNAAAELTYLLYYVLEYPSLAEAENHRLASRRGRYDINK
jgi:hypothetical protein